MAKRKAPAQGPAKITDQDRYDGAQWFYYQWLSRAELAGIPRTPYTEPEPGEI